MNWKKCWALVLLFAACPAVVTADEPPTSSTSQEAKRFEEEKHQPNQTPPSSKSTKAPMQSPIDYYSYMIPLRRQITAAWHPPQEYKLKRVQVIFKVHRDGSLSNLRLLQSCGVAVADQAALDGVKNAAPFTPLPDGADDVVIQFTYDYNVFKQQGGGHGTFRNPNAQLTPL